MKPTLRPKCEAVEEFPPISEWLKELPWRAKPRVPRERALKTVSETGVKSDPEFCLVPTIDKTNSDEVFYKVLLRVWPGTEIFFTVGKKSLDIVAVCHALTQILRWYALWRKNHAVIEERRRILELSAFLLPEFELIFRMPW